MRVFIALEFPKDIKEYLVQIQQVIREQSITGNFTRNENFHLTLRFIGEIQISELEKLKKAIDQVALHQNDFQLTFKELGHFPRGKKQIIWVGLQPNEMLNQLYSNLEMALEVQGYPSEGKGFVPHITLGRQIILTEELNKIGEQIKLSDIGIPISKISIMESSRLNGELTYSPIYAKTFNSNEKQPISRM